MKFGVRICGRDISMIDLMESMNQLGASWIDGGGRAVETMSC